MIVKNKYELSKLKFHHKIHPDLCCELTQKPQKKRKNLKMAFWHLFVCNIL